MLIMFGLLRWLGSPWVSFALSRQLAVFLEIVGLVRMHAIGRKGCWIQVGRGATQGFNNARWRGWGAAPWEAFSWRLEPPNHRIICCRESPFGCTDLSPIIEGKARHTLGPGPTMWLGKLRSGVGLSYAGKWLRVVLGSKGLITGMFTQAQLD